MPTLLAAAAVAGCGGGDSNEKPSTSTRPAPKPQAATVARDHRACLELWNAEARAGDAGQKSPTDFLIDLAENGGRRVLVFFDSKDCTMFAPLADRKGRALFLAAPGGRRPWSMPSTIDLKRDLGRARIRTNARLAKDGTLRWSP